MKSLVICGLIFVNVVISVQGKITCFDQKKDIDGNWVFSAGYQYVENGHDLPSPFPTGAAALDGSGIWYIQGSGSGKEVKLTIERKLYSSRARSVQIFIRYYDKSPRSMSLYPVKGPLPLVTLPSSSGGTWTEVRYDLDTSGPPVEISAFLSAGHVVAFDKIVLAVDSNLPQNASAACEVISSPSTAAGGSKETSSLNPRGTLTTPSKSGTAASPTSPTQPATTNTQCVSVPPVTECKCNCLCNCNKC